MSDGYGKALWQSSGWRREALAWLDGRLGEAGIARTGEPDRWHVRPWATALRAPTDAGPVWMKAAGPATAFEVGLYEVLHRVAPEHVLRPIATDTERAWMVLEDGGPVLTAMLEGDDLVGAMADALTRYAELQRLVAPHAEELVPLGAVDMRPAVLPERFEQALALAGDDRTELEALRPRVADWCAELSAAPGGASIDHNDLHADNVFAGPPPRAYDWGDSVVAHPFASMLVPARFMGEHSSRLRDAYLDGFADLAPRAELVRTLELATHVALIAHAITWDRVLGAMAADDVPEDWRAMPARFLSSLLEGP